MPSFFDQLDAQLRDVAGRDLSTASAGGRRPARRRPPRYALAALGVLSVGGTAIAAVALWRPVLGEPGLGSPPTISASAPPPAQLAALGVLRRPQTAADRSAPTQEELRYMSDTASGVRTAYIRLLSDDTGAGPAILVPAARITRSPVGAPPVVVADQPRADALCLLIGDLAGDGSAKRCYTLADVLGGRATLSLGDELFGVVPDAVRRVVVTFADGSTEAAVPTSNLFAIALPAGEPAATMTWRMATGRARRFDL